MHFYYNILSMQTIFVLLFWDSAFKTLTLKHVLPNLDVQTKLNKKGKTILSLWIFLLLFFLFSSLSFINGSSRHSSFSTNSPFPSNFSLSSHFYFHENEVHSIKLHRLQKSGKLKVFLLKIETEMTEKDEINFCRFKFF